MQKRKFRELIWKYYKENGRHDLPWRKTQDPYKILVSEIMLQQTQVERVLSYYKKWLKQFPTLETLAEASLGDVLIAWQGLGYNRRAKALWETSKIVTNEQGGKFPKTRAELERLPGIGSYTAGAVLCFAHNEPEVLIETNIRTVVTHHFYSNAEFVSDAEIVKKLTQVLDDTTPREWNWALMDYGAQLKRMGIKVNSKSTTYTKQSQFKGSTREVRGAILRALSQSAVPISTVYKLFENSRKGQVMEQLATLEKEKLIEKKGIKYSLP